MNKEKLTVGASISESYHFLFSHMPHFLRLIYGPLILWVIVKITQQYLIHEHDTLINTTYFLNLFTAAFAIIWYRQFLLGAEYTSYRDLLKKGFNNHKFSFKGVQRAVIRIIVISFALLVPTLVLSIGMMVYYQGQGIFVSESLIQELAIKSTIVVMLIFSPIFVRLSLYTAGFALGRSSLSFKDVWRHTRGYTVTLWWVAIRGFLPLSIYSYVLTWLLHRLAEKLSLHYMVSTIIIETIAAFLTFMMLSIVVAANAEAFRILIGVRDGDAPHRKEAGKRRDDVTAPTDISVTSDIRSDIKQTP